MEGKIAFIQKYRRLATQHTGRITAGNWMRLAEALETAGITLTAEQAAKWADLGYLPEEAGPLILDGITADHTRELEDHAAAQAGGRHELAAQRIAEWRAAGFLVIEGEV